MVFINKAMIHSQDGNLFMTGSSCTLGMQKKVLHILYKCNSCFDSQGFFVHMLFSTMRKIVIVTENKEFGV